MALKVYHSLSVCLCVCFVALCLPTVQASIHERSSEANKLLEENEYDDETHLLSAAEKRRLVDIQRSSSEDKPETLKEEDEDARKSELERFIKLLEDEEDEEGLESTVEDDDSTEGTRAKDDYSLNPRERIKQLLDDINREKEKEEESKSLQRDKGIDRNGESFTSVEENSEASSEEALQRKEEIPGVGELFEGDIVMDTRLFSAVSGENEKRDAVTEEQYLWPNARVPYVLSDKLGDLALERIREAIEDYHKYTCVRFVPRLETDVDYLYFFSNKSMCYSTVGRAGGKQKVSIGRGCERKGTVIHEMLHSIGFIHEQSRPDRDKHVKVFNENIKKKMLHNFKKYPSHIVSNLGEEYDYDSVMHYHNKAFSRNGDDTLQAIDNPTRRFGQRVGFSKTDIRQVNKLYPCHKDEDIMDDIAYE